MVGPLLQETSSFWHRNGIPAKTQQQVQEHRGCESEHCSENGMRDGTGAAYNGYALDHINFNPA
jgi:hypothetical protein